MAHKELPNPPDMPESVLRQLAQEETAWPRPLKEDIPDWAKHDQQGISETLSEEMDATLESAVEKEKLILRLSPGVLKGLRRAKKDEER